MYVLGSGSEHKRHFRLRRKSCRAGMQNYFANFLAGRGAARFPSDGDGEPMVTEGSCQLFELRALAAAVETFEGNEFSARGHVEMIAGKWSVSDQGSREPARQADILTYGSDVRCCS